ncbi:MAG TPA: hypothetical protein VNZ01_05480 [Solirubrobacteraceae bacterium]|nr:hypothetical protein [Solirubrobacteraceae bacterium]
MHTHEIHIAGGREAVSEIRRELFVFSEVLDVLATSRADSLVVVFSGRPRPAEWNGRLRDAGYQLLRRPVRSSDDAIARRLVLALQARDEPLSGRSDAVSARRPRARRRRRTRAISELQHVSPAPAAGQPRPSGAG